MRKHLPFLSFFILIATAACSATEPVEALIGEELSYQEDAITDAATNSSDTVPTAVTLTANYPDALDEVGQLAIGTLALEETEYALSVAQAERLLPLWQALQALAGSDATAGAEVAAVVNQISGVMDRAQIEQIAAMQLTTASFGELVQSGAIQLGRGNAPGEDQAGGQDGRQGRGGLGAPPAGGPGGGPGAAGLSEDEIAARRAERFGDGGGDANTGFMTNAVINLLAAKAGAQEK